MLGAEAPSAEDSTETCTPPRSSIPSEEGHGRKEMSMREALNLALDQAMDADDRVSFSARILPTLAPPALRRACRRNTVMTGCSTHHL